MNRLVEYVRYYYLALNKRFLVIISLILSVLIYTNYHFKLNSYLLSGTTVWIRLIRFTAFYLSVFAGSYLVGSLVQKRRLPSNRFFYLLLCIAPVIFAAKVSVRPSDFLLLDDYFLITMQWPLKAIVVLLPVMLMGIIGKYQRPYFGLGLKGIEIKPYFILLLLMVPLLIIAGMGQDFQHVYPKLQMVGDAGNDLFLALLFELSYGVDFFTIELFFRGFLIIAFIKYAGKDAILPMAVFYCAIHFGKPLAECISSYFGGLILGAIVYNTRSIWGGLVVHLGIAWLMEVIGIAF